MIQLFIVCLVIRTIGGQSLLPQRVYPVSVPVVSLTLQPPFRDVNYGYSPVTQRLPFSQQTGLLLSNTGSNVTPVRFTETLPRRQLFTPLVEAINRPLTKTAALTDTPTPTEEKFTEKDDNGDVYNISDAKHEPDENITTTSEATTTPEIKINSEKTEPKKNVTLAVNATDISLDTRANFEGDKCPVGYTRVNGSSQCVQTD
ncbi:hypothetical protein O0L34_g8625 [Tuta absoluta]|nr:hypothetical protein O0L34_g8625 [Tuta absoluta]